jgi:hypothetical protein
LLYGGVIFKSLYFIHLLYFSDFYRFGFFFALVNMTGEQCVSSKTSLVQIY